MAQLERKQEDLQLTISSLRGQLKNGKNEDVLEKNTALKNKLKEKKDEVDDLLSVQSQLKSELHEKKKEIDQIKSEKRSLQNDVDRANAELSTLKEEVIMLRGQLRNGSKNSSASSSSVDLNQAAMSEKDRMLQEADEMRQKLSSDQVLIKTYIAQIERIDRENSELKQKVLELENSLEGSMGKRELETNLERKNSDNSVVELAKLQVDFKIMEKEKEGAEKERNILQNERDELKQECEEERRKYEEVNEKLNKVQTEVSNMNVLCVKWFAIPSITQLK